MTSPGRWPELESKRLATLRFGATPSSGVRSVAELLARSASGPFVPSSSIRTVFERLSIPAGNRLTARTANVALRLEPGPPPSKMPRASEQEVPATLPSGHDQPAEDPFATKVEWAGTISRKMTPEAPRGPR